MPSIIKVTYTGSKKINAIKAYREFTGAGLKESKEAIENPHGILLPRSLAEAMFKFYVAEQHDGGYTESELYGHWAVGLARPKPADPLNLKHLYVGA